MRLKNQVQKPVETDANTSVEQPVLIDDGAGKEGAGEVDSPV